VIYPPNDPSEAVVDRFGQRHRVELLLFGLGLSGLVACAFL
jgi:hypothetical protein